MIAKLAIKLMFVIAGMSKKASVIYCILLTLDFLLALALLLSGVILINPDNMPPQAIPLTITGGVLSFLCLAAIAITTISSNYVRKNPHKNPKNQDK